MEGKIKKINKLLKNREASAVEIIEKYINYAKKINPDINSLVYTTYEAALKSAAKIDDVIAAGNDIPLLGAVPMSIKDNICTMGIPTTCCSKMLLNHIPIYDAYVVKQLKNSSTVMLGKSNMDEFGMGSTCETSFFGTGKNPYNTDYVPGGSSGGAAAGVASDIFVFALGSDTGGSVRQPAGFCGCVGLKPTYGAISRYGLVAYASSFDQIGVIANSVEDTAIVFDAINSYDNNDATCIDIDRQSVLCDIDNGVKDVKIAVLSDLFTNIDSGVDKTIKSAVKQYEAMGAKVSEIHFDNIEAALPVYYILASAEAASNLSRYDGVRYGYRTAAYSDFDDMVCKTRSEGFGVEVKRRIMLGNYVLSSGYYDKYYAKAQKMREYITQKILSVFDKYDVIVAPTCGTTAFKTGEFNSDPTSIYSNDLCTVIANICGLPAISIPCGYVDDMPVGMQLIGNKFNEKLLLKVAYTFENEKYSDIYIKPKVGGDCLGI